MHWKAGPIRPSHMRSRALDPTSHPCVPSPAHAAGSAGDLTTGQLHAESTSQQDMLRAALLARAKIKFSGQSGGVVASGIETDAATAEKPTYGHVRAAMDIVFNDLDDALFDPHAEHRPCGVLDRYEAVGMLLGDACGLPLMPARPHGLAAGNKARKLPPKISAEIETARKRAKRRGEDAAEAEATVLRLCAGVKLPSAAECAASAALAPAPEPQAEPAPPPAPPPAQATVALPDIEAMAPARLPGRPSRPGTERPCRNATWPRAAATNSRAAECLAPQARRRSLGLRRRQRRRRRCFRRRPDKKRRRRLEARGDHRAGRLID